MTAEERIEKAIEDRSKTLSPADRNRWKWGYVDGLRDALRIIRAERETWEKSQDTPRVGKD